MSRDRRTQTRMTSIHLASSTTHAKCNEIGILIKENKRMSLLFSLLLPAPACITSRLVSKGIVHGVIEKLGHGNGHYIWYVACVSHGLEGKRENYQVCSVQYCVQQLCAVQCTHIRTDLTVVCWLDLAFLWLYCVLLFICVRCSCLGLFYVLFMCLLLLLYLVSSVLCQEIG